MVRSRLKKKFDRKRTAEKWDSSKTQQNFRVSLFKKTKKYYFSRINGKNFHNNKTFSKYIKPCLSNKKSIFLMLLEKMKVVTNTVKEYIHLVHLVVY